MATIKRQQRAYRRRLSRFRSLQLTLYNNICALFDRPRAGEEDPDEDDLFDDLLYVSTSYTRYTSRDSVSHVIESKPLACFSDFLPRVYLSSRIDTNCASFVHYFVTMNEREKLRELCFASECEFKKKEKSFYQIHCLSYSLLLSAFFCIPLRFV